MDSRSNDAQQFQANPSERQQHPLANYQFSPDELRAIKECDVESLIQRSLPIGTGFGLAAYYAVRGGYLKGSVKWGPTPKTVVASIIGYFIGKLSYQNKCAEKIMALPDSKLGEMLKMKKKGGLYENLTPDQGFGAGLALAPFQSATEKYSDELQRSTSLNLDTERPSMSGLDDTFRPNLDGPASAVEDDNIPLSPPKNQTSYDELRLKHREDFAKKNPFQQNQNPLYRPMPSQEATPVVRPEQQADAQQEVPRGAKNKYGDVWTQ
ncbi:OCIA domain-containing protein 1-like [Bradysia coprophila]|uniref:OCIA domain-containing protein 1-like n=1 Tax=Bradysia coprophila TaxID=38358 RepID=UPI00187DC977|nr:OCIA domain-containing protein 1-like [Bradysia coprophila]XP_037034363.1 OCIA domain-containing protein 1-like [Bradysia coprophila]XP_037034364.1 OCIA domain-containing protein 1-like [Bradysia coprophila]